jgi:NitT/TauT family transport system substrate-binding protein
MDHVSVDNWSRREFLAALCVATSAGFLGVRTESLAAEPPLETTKLRLFQPAAICWAPQFMAEELLRTEGFTEVEYVKVESGVEMDKLLAAGKGDMSMGFGARHILRVDAGEPVVVLAGIHTGCFELFGNQKIRSIRDLKGKHVGVTQLGSGRHLFLVTMLKHVGLDPRDVNWVTEPADKSMQLFAEGKIDALMAFPPEPQELRAKRIGHVVVNTMMDRPWSQYFCCMVVSNREFVRKYPGATKRALRAMLRATEITSREPEKAARRLVDRGVTKHYDYALQAMKEIHYGHWREYDPEDTVRFLSLRLHEAGLIKLSPQKILAQSADWKFVTELKKELKT